MYTVDVQKYVFYYLISNVSNSNTLICLIVKVVLIFNVSNSNTTYSNNTSCSQWACSVVCLCVVFPGFPLAVLVYRPVVTDPLGVSNNWVLTLWGYWGPGSVRDSEQAVPSRSEEHRPGDEPREHGGGGAGEDPEQLPGRPLGGVSAGRRGGEAERPQEEG